MDRPKAITAIAHKLARLVHFMLSKGQAYYVEAAHRTTRSGYREQVVQNLTSEPMFWASN